MDRDKALDIALANIEKQFGKGSLMRLGDEAAVEIPAIPTGALSLDIALGIGGLPRGRVVEIYGPESSGKCLTAGTYVWSDHGLETLAELFARVGQPLDGAERVTDVRDRGVRLVDEHDELQPMAAVTHNGLQPVWRVELRSGRHVEATANHPLRALDGEGHIVWREVGELRAGDVVVSALFGADTAVGAGDLPEDEAVLLGELTAERSGRPADLLGSSATGVPHAIRTGGPKAQRAFLAGLWTGAGWVGPGPEVGLTTGSRSLAEQVQLLLLGLGVPASLRSHEGGALDQPEHTVLVSGADVHRFVDEVGFFDVQRTQEVHRHLARTAAAGSAPGTVDLAPQDAAGRRLVTDRIVAVTPAGVQPTFDVVVPTSHSFLANGVLSHNTTIALHVIAEAQRAGGIAAFIDAEHALDPTYARSLGVDINELLVSQPDTGEQALEIADMLVRSGAIDIVVIDSVAALTPRAEIEGEMGDSHVGLQARLMSQALRKLAGSLKRSNTTAVFINQLREKVGVMFGSPETTPGGRALKFYSSVRLDVRRIETLKDGTEAVGNRVRVKVVKNKVAPPFRLAEFDIIYSEGISKEGSLIDVGVDEGIIRKAGAWYTYDGEQLGQGKENARTFLKEHADIALEIEKKVKEKLGIEPLAAPPAEHLPDEEPEDA